MIVVIETPSQPCQVSHVEMKIIQGSIYLYLIEVFTCSVQSIWQG